MKHTRLSMTAISLFLLLTLLASGESEARGGRRGVKAESAGEHFTAQRRGKRQTQKKEPAPRPRSFSKDLGELRSQFNRDKGQVRLLMLLSPT
jgi:hypothetical protein